jgi:hypothetical protein
MKRFTKFGAIALVAVITLTTVIATVAFADSTEDNAITEEAPMCGGMMHRALGALNTKVADILGVDEEVLADAFQQAWEEVRDELGELDEGVKPKDLIIGKVAATLGISEEQLTAAIEEARQELQVEVQERIQERQEERLQEAVENGTITEDEANQIREWWQNRPAALDKLRPAGRPFEGMGGNGRFGNGGLWQDSQNMGESEAILTPTVF